VATNYYRGLDYLESMGVKEVWILEKRPHPGVVGTSKDSLSEKSVSLANFRNGLKILP
jgi:histidinol-phosphatase (PHP family)